MKIVFLIISGADEKVTFCCKELYEQFKILSRMYYSKMSQIYDFRYYFMEYNENIENEILEKDDFIYLKGNEVFEKIYEKTQRCIQYITDKYDYDYIVRTNLSSFWNIPNLFKLNIPLNNCLTGYLMFDRFISGTGIIMSRDVCKYLCCQPYIDGPDDCVITNQIQNYCSVTPITDFKLGWLIDCKNNIPDNIDDILYFRIRNEDDRTNDIICFKLLLNKIYNL